MSYCVRQLAYGKAIVSVVLWDGSLEEVVEAFTQKHPGVEEQSYNILAAGRLAKIDMKVLPAVFPVRA
ncbi:MAG: hypothetical protein U5L96_09260 [Owenweeksia sp.]|nr:hypothetical protein [Owenweeksia sp.]